MSGMSPVVALRLAGEIAGCMLGVCAMYARYMRGIVVLAVSRGHRVAIPKTSGPSLTLSARGDALACDVAGRSDAAVPDLRHSLIECYLPLSSAFRPAFVLL